MDIRVTISGPLFKKDIAAVVERSLREEAFLKVRERWLRKGGRGIGRRRNTMIARDEVLTVRVSTSLKHPRRSGKSWQNKQIRIAKAMIRGVLNKAAQRAAADLG